MGTYTTLSVAGYPLIETKSAVVPDVMTVFREHDRREYQEDPGAPADEVLPADSEAALPELCDVIEYACTVGEALDRLDVMGYTRARVAREFEAFRQDELRFYQEAVDEGKEGYDADLALFQSMPYERYAAAFANVIGRIPPGTPATGSESDPIEAYILADHDDCLFGFPVHDSRSLIRAACEHTDRAQLLQQDISELVSAGYYDVDEPVCESAVVRLVSGHPENAPQIILTEGSTDALILSQALPYLYPHLDGYYTFLDFATARAAGGASALVATVKAFAGAGITNRMIALFDNDTIAREACRGLKQVPLPGNIVVMHYPPLEWLGSYPTVGATGLVMADVNQLAGSIELYVGRDCLIDAAGTLRPVHWGAPSAALGTYQGEVGDKAAILAAFRRKIELARTDPEAAKQLDWTGLHAIFQEVFHAFDETHPRWQNNHLHHLPT